MYSHPQAFRTPATAAEILRAYHVAKASGQPPVTVNRLWNSYLETVYLEMDAKAAAKRDMERDSDGESNQA